MRLNRLKIPTKSLAFRLTAWYSAVLIVGGVAFCGLLYGTLIYTLQQVDRERITGELAEYVKEYDHSGFIGLKKLDEHEHSSGVFPFLIRIYGTDGNIIYMNPPEWGASHPPMGEKARQDHENRVWSQLKKQDDHNSIELVSVNLRGGLTLQIGLETNLRSTLIRKFEEIIIIAAGVLAILGFACGLFISSRALTPIQDLARTLRHILETGNLEERAPQPHAGDELDELSTLFNSLLETNDRLIKGMRDVLDAVAHDLRTPMTHLRAVSEMALRNKGGEKEYENALAVSIEETDRLLLMLTTLMDISEAHAGAMKLKLEPVLLTTLTKNLLEQFEILAEEKSIQIETSIPETLVVVVDRMRWNQALANLLDNAIKYTPSGGKIIFDAFVDQQGTIIHIKDNGVGIPPSDIPRIWDRLFRGNQSRSQKGMGLGLSLVKAIIEAHHGTVHVESAPSLGSVFTIRLPLPS